jgi:TPR repeat protein
MKNRNFFPRNRLAGNAPRGLLAAFCLACGLVECPAVDMKDVEAAVAEGKQEYAVVITKDLANLGNGEAALFLAHAYLNADGVEGDLPKAVKWFFKAEEKGVVDPKKTLPLLRHKIHQSSRDDSVTLAIRKAFKEYRETEIAGRFPELTAGDEENSGDSIGARLFKAGRKEVALTTLLNEADALDQAAAIYLKVLYFNRVEGVPEHDPRILEYFRKSAGEGNPQSRELLGRILMSGIGAAKSENQAMEMLEGAASQESRELLANAYLTRGWEEKASALYLDSAREGGAWGNYQYALLLMRAGLHKDAATYFERTLKADPQHWPAMVKLGKTLVEGKGMKPQPQRGFALYKRAADDGKDPVSAYVVGLLYLKGIGVGKSKDNAIPYLAKAAAQGISQAKQELDRLTESDMPRTSASDADVPMDMDPAPSKTKPASSASKPTRPKHYVVEEGDTFYGITLDYGVSYRNLRRANPRVNEAKLKVGQKIVLPAK